MSPWVTANAVLATNQYTTRNGSSFATLSRMKERLKHAAHEWVAATTIGPLHPPRPRHSRDSRPAQKIVNTHQRTRITLSGTEHSDTCTREGLQMGLRLRAAQELARRTGLACDALNERPGSVGRRGRGPGYPKRDPSKEGPIADHIDPAFEVRLHRWKPECYPPRCLVHVLSPSSPRRCSAERVFVDHRETESPAQEGGQRRFPRSRRTGRPRRGDG